MEYHSFIASDVSLMQSPLLWLNLSAVPKSLSVIAYRHENLAEPSAMRLMFLSEVQVRLGMGIPPAD